MQGGSTFSIPLGNIQVGTFAIPMCHTQGGSTFAIPIGYMD